MRLSPQEVLDDFERSRNLAIGRGRRKIMQIKHGTFVGAEVDIRSSNVGSLAAAMEGNCLGTKLCIDRSTPPVNVEILEIDERHHLDVCDGQLVAVVTDRHANQPNLTDIEASLARVAAA